MADNNITIEQAEGLIDEFKRQNFSTQYSTFIPTAQIEELLNQEGSIGLNIYNGYADGKIHLVFVSAQASDVAEYEIQDNLSIIKNTLAGDPEISIVPNELNS